MDLSVPDECTLPDGEILYETYEKYFFLSAYVASESFDACNVDVLGF